MKRMVALAAAAIFVILPGCANLLGGSSFSDFQPKIYRDLVNTVDIYVAGIEPLKIGRGIDDKVPAPEYQKFADRFLAALINKLQEEGFVLVEENEKQNILTLRLKFFMVPALLGPVPGTVSVGVEMYQNGELVSQFAITNFISILGPTNVTYSGPKKGLSTVVVRTLKEKYGLGPAGSPGLAGRD